MGIDKHKYISRISIRALAWMLVLLLCMPMLNVLPSAQASSDGMMRVKLSRLGSPSSITFRTTCDYYFASHPDVRIAAGSVVQLTASGDQLSISVGKRSAKLGSSAQLMRSRAGKYGVQFTSPSLSNLFCGDLFLSASSSVISTVLNIYIEDYLYGVVGYEISPSYDMEALKTQAVAARTYALRQKAGKSATASYDVTDSTDNQVFKGYNSDSSYANVAKAVDATSNIVLYYGNSLAACYYSASNGGQTESSRNVWGGALAYSVVKDDPYDYESGGTKKSATINKNANGLNESLKNALIAGMADSLIAAGCSTAAKDVDIEAIKSITASNAKYAAPSRIYNALTFKVKVTGRTAKGKKVSGHVSVDIPTYGALESWYDLSINATDNETIWVTEKDKSFEICFRRNGHGVGMSQRGTQVMAKNYGKGCAEILEFYYPGTTPKRLSLTDTTQDIVAPQATQPAMDIIASARLSQKADLYIEASASGMVSSTLAAGTTVDVYAVRKEWAMVGSGGKYGYLQADALTSFALKDVIAIKPESTLYAQVVADNANVLQLPVSAASSLAKTAQGSYVEVVAYSNQWALVKTPADIRGYMFVSDLKLVVAEATPTPDPGETVVASDDLYARLTQTANLYASIAQDADVLEALETGTYVKAIAYNRVWTHVRTSSGVEGVIETSALKAIKGEPQGFKKSSDTAPDSEGVEMKTPSKTTYIYVKNSSTYLYNTYSTDSDVVAKLYKADCLQVSAYNSQWAYVSFNGQMGYVPMSELAKKETMLEGTPEGGEWKTVSKKQKLYVDEDTLIMYDYWSQDSRQIATLSKGDCIEVDAYNSKWVRAYIEGVQGFVLIAGLTK